MNHQINPTLRAWFLYQSHLVLPLWSFILFGRRPQPSQVDDDPFINTNAQVHLKRLKPLQKHLIVHQWLIAKSKQEDRLKNVG